MSSLDASAADHKHFLLNLAQRISGKCATKEDVTFENKRFGKQIQTTIILHLLDDLTAEGELSDDARAAETSAAFEALKVLEERFESLGSSITGEWEQNMPAIVKEKAIELKIMDEDDDRMMEASVKAFIHGTVREAIGRQIEKGELGFSYVPAGKEHMYHATIQVAALPGALGKKEFKGEASPFKRDSQLDCCYKVLEAIFKDKSVGPKLDLEGKIHVRSLKQLKEKRQHEKVKAKQARAALAEKEGRGKSSSKGKGKGKGKGSAGGKGKGMKDAALESSFAEGMMWVAMAMKGKMGGGMGMGMGGFGGGGWGGDGWDSWGAGMKGKGKGRGKKGPYY